MKVLITGASGFIGRHVLQHLQSQPDLELFAPAGRHAAGSANGIDLCDPACLQALPAAQAIVHLAGIVGLQSFDRDPLGSWKANLLSTLHILEHARRCGTQHLILASSYIYGQPRYLPVDENHPIDPHHAYQRSKYLSEQMAEQYAHDGGAPVTILRLFNVYGPDQDEQMLIPSLVRQADQPVIELRDPFPRRDFVHVRDVAAAVSAALRQSVETVNRFNIGSGHSLSVQQLAETLIALLGEMHPDRPQPDLHWQSLRREAEVDEVVADISRARRELAWQPRISLRDGLKELLCAS